MTGATIRSKKSSTPEARPWRLGRAALSALLGFSNSLILIPQAAQSAVAPKLPVLQNVGIVPLSVEEPEGHDPKLEDVVERIGERFPEVVRNSRRFRVVNDEVVADLWKDPKGRQELVSEYEVHALVGLTAAPQSDVVTLTARVMNPALETLVHEQDRVPRDWLLAEDSEALEDRLEKLVFALFNRIPVDVSVTSVQGQFITISGGAEQGVQAGDKVDLQRVKVKALHPANGSWLGFEARKLGTAEVIDVKSHNSVAKLIGQSHDGAVEVGDGARIPAIRSRNKFARLAQEEGFKDAGEQSAVIVPPVYLGEPPVRKPLAPKGGMKKKPAPAVAPAPKKELAWHESEADEGAPASPSSAAEEDEEQATPVASPTQPEGGPPPDEDASEGSILDKLKSPQDKWIDDAHVYVGPHWWTVRGPVNSSGKFPLWLLNSVGLGITRTIFYKIKVGFGGGALFGQTDKGSFVGYDGNGRIYWEDAIESETGFLSWWHLGGYASLSGFSVSKERYGGGDWLRGGIFFGFGGSIVPGGSDDGGAGGTAGDGRHARGNAYDWFADIALLPLNIGRFGYGGKQQLVESAFGTRFGLGAYLRDDPGVVQWGGAVEISDERLTLKNSRRPHMTDYRLKLLARYAF
jgi:hypothetical protein